MNDIAIRVEGLGKQYRIGERQRATYGTLRDRLAGGIAAPFRRLASAAGGPPANGNGTRSAEDNLIWALRDVSFEVRRGEVVGIIGHNGAGKSTLLKILSRITDPTSGYVDIHGRVGSLLEVGTGFHPELTGAENVYLNGAILGMKRAEIRRKFDEIVAFAEVELFIDTPVKHYSSGMYLRLAFAVAAHLEPEILVVDEVLAVGDANFQRKCLDTMGAVARGGRTVLLVSHNLSAVLRLCPDAILLDRGRVVAHGPSSPVVDQYMTSETPTRAEKVWAAAEAPNPDGPFRPLAVRIRNPDRVVTASLRSTEAISIEVDYQLTEALEDLRIAVRLYSAMGELLFISSDRDDALLYDRFATRSSGRYTSRCRIPADLLNQGGFVVGVSATAFHAGIQFTDPYAVRFTVDTTGGVGSQWRADRGGFFRPALDWEIGCEERSGLTGSAYPLTGHN